MPYFPIQIESQDSFVVRTHCTGYPSMSCTVDDSPQRTGNYAVRMESRFGTNFSNFSSLPDTIKSEPYFVWRKIKIGHEWRSVRRKKWYLDRKGHPRFRWYDVLEKRDVFERVRTVRYRKYTRPKFSSFLLPPNALQYHKITNELTPLAWSCSVHRPYDGITEEDWSWNGVGFLTPHSDPNQYRYGNVGTGVCQPLSAYPATTGTLIDSLSEEALTKLYKKVQNEFPDYLTALAEAPKAFKQVSAIVRDAIKVIRGLKKLDTKLIKQGLPGISPADLASTWLSYIYGIAPVINDINETVDLINREARAWRSYSASATSVQDELLTEADYISALGTRIQNKTTTVRYGVIMTGDVVIERIISRHGNLSTFVGTAYELTPFSFMLDWVIDISSFLKSRNVLDSHVLHMWKTVYVKERVSASMKFNGVTSPFGSGTLVSTGSDLNSVSEGVSVIRTIINNPPPMPAPRVTPLHSALSTLRSVNALSIWLASFRKR